VLGELGRRASFLVLGRPETHDLPGGKLRLQAALFEAERPVLMVPPGPAAAFGDTIAIAWRDDGRTIHAVKAALPLLTQARTVHVLVGRSADRASAPALLAEHAITASLHEIDIGPNPFGAALLERAHALGADLLVMGAYTHSAWRQLMLGKATRYVLAQADLPVLMRH
jgi:nucleotide-binding universal stress UspA family protein